MSYDFEQFANQLNDEDRGALFSAVPFLTAMVAHADGHYSFQEKVARWKTFLKTKTDIDPSFVSKEAIADIDAHLKKVHQELAALPEEKAESRIREELGKIRRILRRMPKSVKGRYEDFLLEECLGVAQASRGFLWVGDVISEQEKDVLHLIISELQLSVESRELRELLEL